MSPLNIRWVVQMIGVRVEIVGDGRNVCYVMILRGGSV